MASFDWQTEEEDSWGDSDSITARYPLRDEAPIQRVVDDLPTYFANLCNEPALPSCRFALNFMIEFEREPAVWEDMVSRIEENGSYIPRFS